MSQAQAITDCISYDNPQAAQGLKNESETTVIDMAAVAHARGQWPTVA